MRCVERFALTQQPFGPHELFDFIVTLFGQLHLLLLFVEHEIAAHRCFVIFGDFTLLELELKTGRTHQIRVHLSHLGYPIAGDDMYGGRHLTVGDVAGPGGTTGRSPRDPLLTRQALHATVLGFTHPITKEPMTFQAPLATDMRDLITLLRECSFVSAPKVSGAVIELEEVMGEVISDQ